MIAEEHPSQIPLDPMERLTPNLRHCERMAGSAKGMVLGQYHLLEELGRGGYGRVYKAQHALMNRLVALKLIAPHLVEDDKVRCWFRREVMAATRLNHPNIVMAYDADEIDGVLFLVMEFVDGPNLEHQIARQGPLPLVSAYQIMHQTALGLQFAHEKGMVHRDIKPENLLLPRQAGGESNPVAVKITDFGLARLHPRTMPDNLTIMNDSGGLGTPAFIAPEQAENIHSADIRSDLYSLGCTFYYALSGLLPFPGPTGMEILAQHLKREPRPLEDVRPDIPPALAGIVRRLMRKNPDKRFQSPADLAGELSFLLGPGARLVTGGAANAIVTAGLVRHDALPGEPLPGQAAPSSRPNTSEKAAPHGLQSASVSTPLPDGQDSPAPAVLDNMPHPATTRDEKAGKVLAQCEARRREASEPHWQVYWRQWFTMVQRLARGDNPRVHEGNYKAVHRELLKTARALAAPVNGAPQERFLRLVALLEPWLTPKSLTALDRNTRSSLFLSCQQLDRELSPKPVSRRFGTLFVSLAGFVIALVVAFWAWAPRTIRFWELFR
jgi:serine/threonine protein kinase